MPEYIEREALEVALNRRLCFLMTENSEYDHYTSGYDEAVDTVENFPSATDVAPVRHGRWIHEETKGGFHGWVCSRCGRGLSSNPEGIDLYCYHCGAKMDGGF